MRAGCEVVEQAVRRGFGLSNEPWLTPPAGSPWASAWTGAASGPLGGPLSGPRTTGQWIDAMTNAFTLWAQWLEAWSATARGFTSYAEPLPKSSPPYPSPQTPPPSPSATGTGTLRFTFEMRAARTAQVELELRPGDSTGFEVHGLLAPPATAAPPITDVHITVIDGGPVVTLGSIDKHPAGTYAGTVLAGGRACGNLTVRLG